MSTGARLTRTASLFVISRTSSCSATSFRILRPALPQPVSGVRDRRSVAHAECFPQRHVRLLSAHRKRSALLLWPLQSVLWTTRRRPADEWTTVSLLRHDDLNGRTVAEFSARPHLQQLPVSGYVDAYGRQSHPARRHRHPGATGEAVCAD